MRSRARPLNQNAGKQKEATSASDRLVGDADIYISADVETDGPIPGPYSMLAFAFVVAAKFDGNVLTRFDLDKSTFYRELRPISDHFQAEALAVNGLDRTELLSHGLDPSQAMNDAAQWIDKASMGFRPVLVAYPAAFDWTWLYWYFVRFADRGCPFGFSACLDIKTMIALKTSARIKDANPQMLPNHLRPRRPHTHRALDDAKEQAELFLNVFEWDGCGP